jgi:hypothetical protein
MTTFYGFRLNLKVPFKESKNMSNKKKIELKKLERTSFILIPYWAV